MHSQNFTLSVVVPAYNEEDALPELHKRLSNVIDKLGVDWEVIYVNDGSTDNTLNVLTSFKDSRVTIIDLSRNFGKEIAMTAGLDYANSDAVVIIDADLQDPPELIPEMVNLWQKGFDVVYAKRTARSGETIMKRATAKLFYRLIQLLSRVHIPEDSGDFRLLSRRAVESMRRIKEQHRFMKGLFAWIGYPQVSVSYRRDPRITGKTKWNYLRLWNLAIEGITSFSIAPLKVATYVGLLTSLGSFVFAAYIIYKTLVYGEKVQGYPTMMTVILFLGGVQLMSLGMIGEYLGRMFNESKQRPLYLVNQLIPSTLQVHPRTKILPATE